MIVAHKSSMLPCIEFNYLKSILKRKQNHKVDLKNKNKERKIILTHTSSKNAVPPAAALFDTSQAAKQLCADDKLGVIKNIKS